MSAESCAEQLHQHSGVCVRAGMALGKAEALDEVEAAIQRLVAEIEGATGVVVGGYRSGLTRALGTVEDSRG